MTSGTRLRWAALWMPLAGVVSLHGCMGLIEQGVDLIVAPGAAGNLIRLSSSGLAPLARLLSLLVG